MRIGNLPETEVHIGQPRLTIEKELSTEGVVASGQQIIHDAGIRLEGVEIPITLSDNVEQHIQTFRSWAKTREPVIIDLSDKVTGLVWIAIIESVQVEQIVKPKYARLTVVARKLPGWGTTVINSDIEAEILDLDGISHLNYFEPQMGKSNLSCDWENKKLSYELILWNKQEELSNVTVINNCENTDGWSAQNDASGGSASVSADSKVKMKNGGAIKGVFESCQNGYCLRLIYTPTSAIDFTSKKYLAFWWWMDKTVSHDEARVRIKDGDGNFGEWYFGNKTEKNKFTRIIIDTDKSFDHQSGTPDKTNITEIQFYIIPNADWSKCVARVDRIVLDDPHKVGLEIFLPDEFKRFKERDDDGKIVVDLKLYSYKDGYQKFIEGLDSSTNPYYWKDSTKIYYMNEEQIQSKIAVYEPAETGHSVEYVSNSDDLGSFTYSDVWGTTYRLGIRLEMPPSTLEKDLDKIDKIRLKIEFGFIDWKTSYVETALETAYIGVAREYPPESHASAHVVGGADPITGLLDANARVKVKKDGVDVGTRRAINFKVIGSGGSLEVTDDEDNEKVDVELTITGGAGEYSIFGDGNDGDVTLSENTTLTRDMFYNNLTIPSGVILYPNGWRIFVRGTLTIAGQINGDGEDGGDGYYPGYGGDGGHDDFHTEGKGGDGGHGEDNNHHNLDGENGDFGGAGGDGGDGGSGSDPGGVGGDVLSWVIRANAPRAIRAFIRNNGELEPARGGGGGGGGGWNHEGPNTGGGGGAGGRVISIFAKEIVAQSGNSIRARGGIGGNAYTRKSDYPGGGGGGGGGGGFIMIVTNKITGTLNLDVTGGSGGDGGNGDPNGEQGKAGSPGRTVTITPPV